MLNNALDGAFVFRTLVATDPAIRIVQLDDDRANGRRVQAALETAWKSPEGRARTLLAAAVAQLPTWTDPAAPKPASGDCAPSCGWHNATAARALPPPAKARGAT